MLTCDNLQPGQSGNLTLHREVLTAMRGRPWQGETPMKAGETFVSISEGGRLWMSNTPDEKNHIYRELCSLGRTAGMNILVGGLGLGFFLEYFQRERNTPASLTVIERSADVIALVAPAYASLPWLAVEQGDMWEYAKTGPRKFFDFAYVDIWGDYNTDLLDEMKRLRRSLLPVVKPGGGRIVLWKENELKYPQRRARQNAYAW